MMKHRSKKISFFISTTKKKLKLIHVEVASIATINGRKICFYKNEAKNSVDNYIATDYLTGIKLNAPVRDSASLEKIINFISEKLTDKENLKQLSGLLPEINGDDFLLSYFEIHNLYEKVLSSPNHAPSRNKLMGIFHAIARLSEDNPNFKF